MNRGLKITIICVLVIAAMLATIFVGVPTVLKTRFKLDHKDWIQQCANEFELDPNLVCALIFTESGFRPAAKSRAGAVGMMQIMPATGQEIAEDLGVEDYSEDSLLDIQLNIRFGCYYFKKMTNRFDGNVWAAMAAYNAGPTKAQEWIDKYGLNEQGKISIITYPETENYVVKVGRAWDIYTMLYGSQWEG